MVYCKFAAWDAATASVQDVQQLDDRVVHSLVGDEDDSFVHLDFDTV